MAYEHAIRIHELSDDTRDRLRAFVQGISGSYVFARETDATRVHYQGWIRCDIKQQAFRVRVLKAFPECRGNKGYSVTQVKDHDKYSQYILKGTKEALPDVVCYCGIDLTEESIANAHRAYWSTHDKPGKSNRSIVEEVEEWAKTQMWSDRKREEWTRDDVWAQRRDVAQRVCDTIANRKKAMNLFYARGVFNTIMYRLDNQFRDDFVGEIISKF